MSNRQLERRFLERIGMPPKQFCRNLRFKNFLKNLTKAPLDSWCATALNGGYYDQSHMIRDFKHYTGKSPGAYVRNFQGGESFFTGNLKGFVKGGLPIVGHFLNGQALFSRPDLERPLE